MLAYIFAWLAWPVCCHADTELTAGASIHFASSAEGSGILTRRDDFVRRLSPFDRAARLKVGRAVSEKEFLTFVGKNVVDWTQEEIKTVQAAIESLRPLLHVFPLPLPSPIQIIKTTGAEEGNFAYTRGTAIILPVRVLDNGNEELTKIICHEVFHIFSRYNPELRERLYGTVGFTRCNEIELPGDLGSRKITNPDAPRNDHFIRLTDRGQPCLAIPVLLSSAKAYDVKRGGEFFQYVNFQLLAVEETANPGRLRPRYEGSRPKLMGLEQVSGFFEQVGRNTKYTIHPEETLADNFVLLVLRQQGVPSPEILQKMREILLGPARPNQSSMEPLQTQHTSLCRLVYTVSSATESTPGLGNSSCSR
jgi:hypothetical protein